MLVTESIDIIQTWMVEAKLQFAHRETETVLTSSCKRSAVQYQRHFVVRGITGTYIRLPSIQGFMK